MREREDKEGDATAKIVERKTIAGKEEEDNITGVLVVATPALRIGAAMVDNGATTEPTKVAGTLTSTATEVAS